MENTTIRCDFCGQAPPCLYVSNYSRSCKTPASVLACLDVVGWGGIRIERSGKGSDNFEKETRISMLVPADFSRRRPGATTSDERRGTGRRQSWKRPFNDNQAHHHGWRPGGLRRPCRFLRTRQVEATAQLLRCPRLRLLQSLPRSFRSTSGAWSTGARVASASPALGRGPRGGWEIDFTPPLKTAATPTAHIIITKMHQTSSRSTLRGQPRVSLR